MPAERKSPDHTLEELEQMLARSIKTVNKRAIRQRDELREIVGEYLACSAFRSIHPQSREGRNRNRAIELLAKLDEQSTLPASGEEGR